jgi:type II secretory pathway component PulF
MIVALVVLFAIVLLNAKGLLPSSIFAPLANRIRLPFGRSASVAHFTRFTADLLEAGVKLSDALRIAGFTVPRLQIQRAAWRLANDIDSTGEFSQRAYARQLTASVAYALAADLPPESRVRLLREISSAHADRLRINLSWASGTIEPVAIFVVGLIVVGTVIGLFLPLAKLIEGLA